MIDYHVIRSLNNLMCHMTACTIYNCFVSIAISVAPVAKHLLQGQEVLDGGVPQQCKVRGRQHSLHRPQNSFFSAQYPGGGTVP